MPPTAPASSRSAPRRLTNVLFRSRRGFEKRVSGVISPLLSGWLRTSATGFRPPPMRMSRSPPPVCVSVLPSAETRPVLPTASTRPWLRESTGAPLPMRDLQHAGVAAGFHHQIAAAERADTGEAHQERQGALHRVLVVLGRHIAAEVDPPRRGHAFAGRRRAAGALAPQPAAHGRGVEVDAHLAQRVVVADGARLGADDVAAHIALRAHQHVAAVLGIPRLVRALRAAVDKRFEVGAVSAQQRAVRDPWRAPGYRRHPRRPPACRRYRRRTARSW